MCLGAYDPPAAALIDRVVRPGWNCLDVGANVGLHTVRLAVRAGPAGQVVAIDANPAVHQRLAENTGRLGNVIRLAVAVGDEPGTGFLIVNDPARTPNQNATMVNADQDASAVRVPVTTLDEVWQTSLGGASVRFVKMDIEGYELKALRGADRLLRTCRPDLFMEYNGPYATALGYGFSDILGYLRGRGPYEPFTLDRRGRLRPLAVPVPDLIDVFFRAT
jgi:FkbM family methyltransferase